MIVPVEAQEYAGLLRLKARVKAIAHTWAKHKPYSTEKSDAAMLGLLAEALEDCDAPTDT